MDNIRVKVLLKLLFVRRLSLLKAKQELYKKLDGNSPAIRDYQLTAFNRIWKFAQAEVPFYEWWAKEHQLPKEVASLEQLRLFPVLTKEIMQKKAGLIFQNGKSYQTVSTGGSTGQPTKFITTASEKDIEYANTYLGRAGFGIKPLDRTILFWGHSHLFGSGMKGQINEVKRKFTDALVSIKRLNAYDLSIATVGGYVRRLSNETADCLIGYTSSVFSLARFIVDNKIELDLSKRLKAVIVTSETVTDRDIDVIGRAFKVPVGIEYGTAETSVVAYSAPNEKGLRIFWDSFIAQLNDGNQLNLTTIYDRSFPLINYATNDVVEPLTEIESSLLRVDNIKGRTRDNVKLRTVDGEFIELSGILLVHIIKGNEGIYAINYKQCTDNEVEIYVVGAPNVDISLVSHRFLCDLKREYPSVDTTAIKMSLKNRAIRTLAGKNAMRVE